MVPPCKFVKEFHNLSMETVASSSMETLLIQGPPRSGKTTLVQFLIDRIDQSVSGFFTKEIRNNEGQRIGFDVIDIESKSSVPLARRSWNYRYTVASYGVDVHAFADYIDKIDSSADIIIIDEIGKMELLYDEFLPWVEEQFETSNVLATIPQNLPTDLKKFLSSKDYHLITITKNSRDRATNEALTWMKQHLK